MPTYDHVEHIRNFVPQHRAPTQQIEAGVRMSRTRSAAALMFGSSGEGFICTYDPQQRLLTVEMALVDGTPVGDELAFG